MISVAEALERVAYEFAWDNLKENVCYVEVRFAPQLHMGAGLSYDDVFGAVAAGLSRAQREHEQSEAVKSGAMPPFRYGIIACAMRMFTAEFSPWFGGLVDTLSESPQESIYATASLELARAAVRARDESGIQVVGFDLAGAEAGFPAVAHSEAFQYVHDHFLKKTVHAGEAYGAESIFQAITELYADRIGHGTYLLDPTTITDPGIEDKESYVTQLGQYIADRRITLEVCLTSNLQTNPDMATLDEHSFKALRAARLSTTICTDNRTVSNTTVTKELMLAVRHLDVDRNDLKSIIVYGFKRSFMQVSYLEKRKYVRSIIDYYEKVERAHFADEAPPPED